MGTLLGSEAICQRNTTERVLDEPYEAAFQLTRAVKTGVRMAETQARRLVVLLKSASVGLALLAAHCGVASADTLQAPPAAERPTGEAGPSSVRPVPTQTSPDFVPILDRWRLGIPDWNRYERPLKDAPFERGRWWDPYNQNVLKGDYPIIGQKYFIAISAISDSLLEFRRIPLPSNVSASEPRRAEFFGPGDQLYFNQNFIVSLEFFKGDTAFRPRDWELRVTPVFNVNYLDARNTGVVDVDVRQGTTRLDSQVSFQELFVEYHLGDLSPNYDFVSSRVGIQPFTSDFRGFIFSDDNLGARFFGNLGSNRNQFNIVYFRPLEKDTNSGLNRVFDTRGQHLGILNYFRQDFIWPGYTLMFNGHYLLNLTHSYYHVVGHERRNPISGRSQSISADMAALELSVDVDWLRPRVAFFWASGDRKPDDSTARGFDMILDNPNFAGGGFSYWVRQGLPLTSTGLELKGRNSLVPSLRPSKLEGQSNFVNPGLFLLNVGTDIDVTPKLKMFVNVNFLRFHHTEVLERLLFQPNIRDNIGIDWSIGARWRPFLIENVEITAGAAALQAGGGLRDVYTETTFRFGPNGLERTKSFPYDTLYSAFLSLTLMY